jgi:hypothetical protein
MPAPAQKMKSQTTTVRLPRRLYEEALSVLEKGATEANSLNDLLVDSLSEKLEQLRREYIDAEFAEMRHDVQYGRESTILARQFISNDRDTLRFSEKDKKP